jgi:cephalosporin hydroxylase
MLARRNRPRDRTVEEIVEDFTLLYYGNEDRTWRDTKFLGVTTVKCPLDLWVYQEIIWRLRPGLVVETGTAFGGSALYLASMCDLVGSGEVVTIDIQLPAEPPAHPRLTYLTGSSTDPEIVEKVRSRAVGAQPVLVILDSDHSREHVRQEIRSYAPLVTPGSYLVVEDTCIRHPVLPDWGEGPWEAVQDFLAEDDRFVVDRGCEKFWLTFNPGGYLRRS